jgi:uncharacterized membrane protein YoaK (UPF0700 family)
MILLAMLALKKGSNAGHYLASAACGLQNAMTSTFSGAVVRTTHVTGIFTDLGIALGLMLRGKRPDKRRTLLYLTLIVGFLSGGIIGSLMFSAYGFDAMLFPATVCVTAAAAYAVFIRRLFS